MTNKLNRCEDIFTVLRISDEDLKAIGQKWAVIAATAKLASDILRHQDNGTYLHRPCASDNDCPACQLRRLARDVVPWLLAAIEYNV